ncbi:MAG: TolB family protein, partial [Gemmatimonadaceae bacterium]
MIYHPLRRSLLTAWIISAPFAPAFAQQNYQSPPADLVKILDAPANPVTSISPNRQWVLVTVSDPRTITISDMADSAYYLAGSKIRANPDFRVENIGIRSATVTSIDGKTERSLQVPSGGRLGSAEWSRGGDLLAYTTISNGATAVEILNPATGRTRRVNAPGLIGRIRDLSWSRDGKNLAFTVTTPTGTALWVADVANATARRLSAPVLNFTTARGNIVDDPGCAWLNGKSEIVCRLWPANRRALPRTSEVPTGVIVQESYGRSAPARTYEYLLQSPADEALFDYYFTDQISRVSLDGRITPVGTPGIHTRVSQSPDGNYLLVETVQRPYSYQVPMDVFPSRTEVWDLNGKVLREIRNSHVAEEA